MGSEQRRAWWESGKARVWRELEAEWRLPARIPLKDRQRVDADFADEVADAVSLRDKISRAELERLLGDYRSSAERVVTTCARYAAALGSMSFPRRKSRREAPREANPEEAFRLRQRTRVLAFVANRILPLQAQLDGNLTPQGRVNWGEVAKEWKEADRGDSHKPETLRVYYWRARTDPRVSEPYVTRIQKLWGEWAQGTLVALNAPEYLSYTRTPEGKLDRISQRFPAPVSRALGVGFDRKCGCLRRVFVFPEGTQLCVDCAAFSRRDCPAFQALCEAGLLEPAEAKG